MRTKAGAAHASCAFISLPAKLRFAFFRSFAFEKNNGLQTFDEAKELVDEYFYFYNNERIQLKTGQTPMEVRYAYTA